LRIRNFSSTINASLMLLLQSLYVLHYGQMWSINRRTVQYIA